MSAEANYDELLRELDVTFVRNSDVAERAAAAIRSLQAELARVKEENRTLRRDETRNERDDLRVRVKELEAQLAALAPKDEK